MGKFVDDELVKRYSGMFDLIIMRHVVEHFLSPISELNWVNQLLVDNGLCYIAVPDMMNPRTKLRDYKYWWGIGLDQSTLITQSNTLFKTLSMAGLRVIFVGRGK